MRSIVVTRSGGPDVLELRDGPEPAPGRGQVLVDVEASGVNYRDVYDREGRYGAPPPFVAGVEGAGTVSAIGEAVDGVGVGDRVAWANAPGSYAQRVAVDCARTVPVPDGVGSELAAAVLLQGLTAHYLCADTYRVREGDIVLVHAAAGGVGLLLTQLVKLRGGRVIATTSTAEKAELARTAGADEVIGYDGFAERVRELSGGGVHAVYDGVGESTFDEGLASLRRRGTMVLYGAASGAPPPVEPLRLTASGSLYLTRPTLHDYVHTREELLGRAGDVFAWIQERRLDVRIGGRYPLEEARRSHEDLEARRTTGKLLLLP